MRAVPEPVQEFLAAPRIAVAGVSRDHNQAANLIYRKLKEARHKVVPVNPRTIQAEGDPCYPDLASVPGGVDAVLVATPPGAATQIVQQCADLGVSRVWMHRAFGHGSVSDEAVKLCREKGISVIVGACPLMYLDPVDVGHRCMRWLLGVAKKLPD